MNKNSGDKMTTDMWVCRKDSLMEEGWGSWAEGLTPATWRCRPLAMNLSFLPANVSYLSENLFSEFCNDILLLEAIFDLWYEDLTLHYIKFYVETYVKSIPVSVFTSFACMWYCVICVLPFATLLWKIVPRVHSDSPSDMTLLSSDLSSVYSAELFSLDCNFQLPASHPC